MNNGKESIGIGDLAEVFGVKEPGQKADGVTLPEEKRPALQSETKKSEGVTGGLPELPGPEYVRQVNIAPDIARPDEIELPAPVLQPSGDYLFAREDAVVQVLAVFEELRRTLYAEVSAHADKKAVDNMMLRSLEKNAACHPVLKDCSWSSAGDLKTDGSVDTERFMKNISAEPVSSQEKSVSEAFSAVAAMRFKSVKNSLGPEKYSRIKNSVLNRMKIIEAGYKKGVVRFMSEEVIEKAVRKAEEAQ